MKNMNNLFRQSTAQLRPLSNDVAACNIRKSFLDYFCEQDHIHIHSSPVFSLFDPTLAFINAGMNQFKDVFLGVKQPAANRVVNFQKCIRIGGKHNDLSLVGQDGTHHSFFEMLGNWSFGDYFKKTACKLSWDLLTKVYGLSPERLYVTYWAGDKTMGLNPDYEVREIWRELGVNEKHILPFGATHNFWEMGTTGPCGTCTEIHYDQIPTRTNAQALVNSKDPYLTELWNLVFIEYNRKSDRNLESLKKHFVDTGMGFERLVAVLQQKTSNYDTDLFSPLFEAIKNHSGHSGYTGQYSNNVMDSSYRILADHGRMIAVALSDGMIPNQQNKVRTIIRKSLLVCEKNFNSNENLLKEVINYVANTLADAYPQIGENLAKIHYIIDSEAEIFKNQKLQSIKNWKTIEKHFPGVTVDDIVETPQLIEGLSYIKKNILDMKKKKIQDDDAWKLFDTIGVPVEVTNKMASLLDLEFSTSSFNEYVVLLKNSIKKTFEKKFLDQKKKVINQNILSKIEKMNLESSKDVFKHEYRINNAGIYEFLKQPATIEAIICNDELLDSITEEKAKGQKVGLLLDRTQMFCENINQESDAGTFIIENKIIFDVLKVVKYKGYAFHFGVFSKFPSSIAEVKVNNIGLLKLDEGKRLKMMKNRTALQLLNTAIRKKFLVAGEKFSKVTPQKLSVDIMIYKEQLNLNDAVEIETFVRNIIRHGVSVIRRLLPYQQFVNLKEVMFVPGNYIIEAEIPVVEINSGFILSREHCSEAHVCNTSDLGDFVITEIKTVSSYIKNIQAVSGEEAFEIRKNEKKFDEHWKTIKEDLLKFSSSASELKEAELKLKEVESELEDGCRGWILKQKILKEIEDQKINIKLLKRQALRKSIFDEMKDLIQLSKENFVIHTLDLQDDKNLDLEVALNACQSKPALIFGKKNKKIIAECFVPKEIANENFNAKNWLTSSLGFLKVQGNHRKGHEPTQNYFIREKEVTSEEFQKAKERAEDFAKKYLST